VEKQSPKSKFLRVVSFLAVLGGLIWVCIYVPYKLAYAIGSISLINYVFVFLFIVIPGMGVFIAILARKWKILGKKDKLSVISVGILVAIGISWGLAIAPRHWVPPFHIDNVEDASLFTCIRKRVYVIVDRLVPLTDTQLVEISRRVVKSVTRKWTVNGVAILLGYTSDYDDQFPVAAVVYWAPKGIWEKACDVSAGNYRTHSFFLSFNDTTLYVNGLIKGP